jgi:tripartite-type tricarboxylate transporter receptor subunit TctC
MSVNQKARNVLIVAAVLVLGISSALAAADKYPTRPIELIVTWGAGGGSDRFGRKIASLAEDFLKMRITVTNSPGASGELGKTKAKNAKADGYTIVGTEADFSINDSMGKTKIHWDDFDYLMRGMYVFSQLYIPSEGVKVDGKVLNTFTEIVEYAKANPGKLRCAGSGLGSTDDISVAYLKAKGIEFTYLPFNKPGERYPSILGGNAEVLFEQPGDVAQLIEGGKIKPIVNFTKERPRGFEDIPTIQEELGIDISFNMWRGVMAPKGLPQDRKEILIDAFRKASETDDYQQFLKGTYSDLLENVCIFGEDFAQEVKTEVDKFKSVLKEIGYIQ